MHRSVHDFQVFGVFTIADFSIFTLLSLFKSGERPKKSATLILIFPDQIFHAVVDRDKIGNVPDDFLCHRIEKHTLTGIGIQFLDRGKSLHNFKTGQNHVGGFDLFRSTASTLLNVIRNRCDCKRIICDSCDFRFLSGSHLIYFQTLV